MQVEDCKFRIGGSRGAKPRRAAVLTAECEEQFAQMHGHVAEVAKKSREFKRKAKKKLVKLLHEWRCIVEQVHEATGRFGDLLSEVDAGLERVSRGPLSGRFTQSSPCWASC